MRADPPPINALGTVNADHVFADVQLSAGIWHHKPGFSYLIRFRRTPQGLVAESTSEKNGPEQLTEHIRAVTKDKGLIAAFHEAFEWLEEQTRPRAGGVS